MGGKRGRSSNVNGQQERVRTHLLFSKQTERQHQKRKRRTQNKLHQVTHKKDEMIQAGAGEVYIGFFVEYKSPFWTWSSDRKQRPPPIQVAGPVLFVLGAVLLLGAILYAVVTSSFFKMYLHHTKQHDEPARVTTITTTYQAVPAAFEKHPYQPLPPPAYPVLENKYAHSSIVRPHDEMKLYPPV
ncbi:hypothetical protein ANCDUO_04821 [Ancylostoma duodenale]|uniref:Uncharacterized protein n=1 Tax=Ancylostoma duodenale TaxID=51022 RepID=A0A0C2D5N7_9BILA|nr:hypothetical protein ANCDUO_04821 [Ancylostoma duodenale]